MMVCHKIKAFYWEVLTEGGVDQGMSIHQVDSTLVLLHHLYISIYFELRLCFKSIQFLYGVSTSVIIY